MAEGSLERGERMMAGESRRRQEAVLDEDERMRALVLAKLKALEVRMPAVEGYYDPQRNMSIEGTAAPAAPAPDGFTDHGVELLKRMGLSQFQDPTLISPAERELPKYQHPMIQKALRSEADDEERIFRRHFGRGRFEQRGEEDRLAALLRR